MATNSNPRKSQTRQKNTKNKSANRKMIVYFLSVLVIFFAATRLGIFGVSLYNLMRLIVGTTAYIAMLIWLAFLVFSVIKQEYLKNNRRLYFGVGLLYLGLICLIQVIFASKYGNDVIFWNALTDLQHFRVKLWTGGGFVGWLAYIPLHTLFATLGTYIVSILLMIVGVFLLIPGLTTRLRHFLTSIFSKREKKEKPEKIDKKKKAALNSEQSSDFDSVLELPEQEDFEPYEPNLNFDNYVPSESQPRSIGLITDDGADWRDVYPDDENDETATDYLEDPYLTEEEPEFTPPSSNGRIAFKTKTPLFSQETLAAEKPATNFSLTDGHYQLPSSELLTLIPPADQSKERAAVKKNSKILEETLKSFNITAKVVSSTVGPSVTKYELKLASGTRVNRILNLSDDLALALAARDVRIEAPIPGKSLVGIEIPNSTVATVGFRDMWEQSATNPEKLLEVPLGKALDGSIRNFDLARMPHLLIAGATGSGKSVAVNGIITGILMKSYPSEVKFLMVDPKMVELSVYNDIPHLLIPVVTNPRKASRALQKVVDEMEERYLKFSQHGVRNIEGYNARLARENENSEVQTPPMPLIVVIVDELADLMMVASKEVEDAIIRLGQKARAAGIHMILATQRPSVDVISGLIKANVPSRVAFAVSSGTDSRTILDQNGAEKLLGRGDMLFKPIDENHPVRLQGAFISDEDVENLVNYIKSQQTADYDESFDPGDAEEDDNRGLSGSTEASRDPLFEQAKAQVITSQKASVAALQRLLKIGFNRATDLMNELEAAGVVGPAKGTTPRKVLMNLSGDFSGDDE